MPTEHRNQTFDQQGNIVSEEVVTVADPLVDPALLDQAIKTMRTMLKTYTDPDTGYPTGTVTAQHMRNWLVALTHAAAAAHNALEDMEPE